MPAYLTRLKQDHQLVGIFVAESANQLFWMVDECCDPYAVEWIELGDGGIYWGNTLEFAVPISEDRLESDSYTGLPTGTSFAGCWGEEFFSETGNQIWKPVPKADDAP